LTGSPSPAASSAISSWRPTALFSVAGFASGLLPVLLSFAPTYLGFFGFGFALYIFFGHGVLFLASMTVAGVIASRLKWMSAPRSWSRIVLAAAITVVSYPAALMGVYVASFPARWLSHILGFAWVATAMGGPNSSLVLSALIASVLVWAALSVVQRQWNVKILLRFVVLGAGWAAAFTAVGEPVFSRLEALLQFDTAPLAIGILLSVGGMLFGGVCGHAFATVPPPHESSAK